MRLPAPSRRTALLVSAAAALLTCALAHGQQPDAAATAASPAKKPPVTAAHAAPNKKGDNSYSLGVIMGEQLRDGGVAADAVDTARIAQGVKDALGGKRSVTDEDRRNMVNFLRGAQQSALESNHRAAATFLAENAKKADIVTTTSGLQYKVIAPGSGASPKATDEVTVNYRGTLLNGTEFDSSYKRGEPATFAVNRVIPGWTEALQLMKPGGKMKLYVPPQLAYDANSRPPIPPGSMLIFDVELLKVQAPAAPAAAPHPPAPAPTQQK